MKINIEERGTHIEIEAKKAEYLRKYSGLMFRTKKTNNLFFEFKKDENAAIHSLFVFFSFLAVWLDDKNKIIGAKIVKPFTFLVRAPKSATRLLEIPLNKKNKDIMNYFNQVKNNKI